ncbi:MAG: hypothetical protein V7K53_17725 [Nostoc sp.]|uniref:hypothetical protein n=1 Tax=Nostoc sp. TaxID=1180 RepID=UPI002FFAFA8D
MSNFLVKSIPATAIASAKGGNIGVGIGLNAGKGECRLELPVHCASGFGLYQSRLGTSFKSISVRIQERSRRRSASGQNS